MILVILVAFTTSGMLMSGVCHSLPDSDAKSMAKGFLEKIAGFNTTKFAIISINVTTAPMIDSNHLQTTVKIVVGDGQNRFEALINFIDGKFWLYNIYSMVGDVAPRGLSFNESLTTILVKLDSYFEYFGVGYGTKFAQAVSAITTRCKPDIP